MLVEDKEITRQINENYVHWDDIQTRINEDPQVDFDVDSEENDFSKDDKEFLPLISESDLKEENETLFRKKIIRKIQEQQIDSSNFYKYNEEQRVMKAFKPFIEDENPGSDYQKVLKNRFKDFVEIPYFYPKMQSESGEDIIESDNSVENTKRITHSLSKSKVNLIKNSENEIEAIEIECNCGEKTRIELQFED